VGEKENQMKRMKWKVASKGTSAQGKEETNFRNNEPRITQV